MQIRPFRGNDLDLAAPPVPNSEIDFSKACADLGPAYTALDEVGGYIGSAGAVWVREHRELVGWAIFNAGWHRHALAVTRAIVRWLKSAKAEYSVDRIRALVQEDIEPAGRWLSVMGFHRGPTHENWRGTGLRFREYWL